MEKKYQAFVSSTYEDLQAERQAVMGTLLENGFIPVGMEQFPASPMSQWEYIKKMIDSSDYYILIIAGRYGSIDPETNISYTEEEYQYALEKGIPVLAFLHSDIKSIESGKCEETTKGKKQLERFRKAVESGGRLVKYYNNADDLKAKVTTATNSAVHSFPRPGWIRADAVEKADAKSKELYAKAQSEIDELKKEVTTLREAQTWGNLDDTTLPQQANYFIGLSNDASVLLVYAANDPDGQIMVRRTLGGTSISTGKWDFVEDGGPREEARWIEAVNALNHAGYIKRVGWESDIYQVTHKGYELSDKIVFDCKVDTNNNPQKYLDE